jgi:DNA-binding CsgD family transcriptional regulator
MCARIAKDLSEGVRRQIFALRNEGYSQRQIAAKMGLSKHKPRNTRKNNQRNNSIARQYIVRLCVCVYLLAR